MLVKKRIKLGIAIFCGLILLSGSSKTSAVVASPFSLVASDVALSDNFGISVAVSGDTAIVGVNLHDALGTNSGAAYIYRWNGSAWVQAQRLLGSDEVAYDTFGRTVAIAGNTAVVVAPNKYTNGVLTGATYVFRYNGSLWVEEQKLPRGLSGIQGANDISEITGSIGISGNILVIGNSYDNTRAYRAGAAYVYRYHPERTAGDRWVEEQTLFASDAAGADFFGFSMAVFGDWIAVGAFGDDDLGISTGSAYIFKRNENGTPLNANDDFWEQRQKLVPADGVAYNSFGWSVAIDGSAMVIGAFQDKDRGLNFGSAYIYRLIGSTWVYEAEIYGSGSSTNGSFGAAVAVSGDTVVVGAYQEDLFWQDGGSAYVFHKYGATWKQEARFEDPAAYARNYFGSSVAISADRALIGAFKALATGTAYVFEYTPAGLCGSDLNVDHQVNASDLAILLSNWGNPGCAGQNPCLADVDDDGAVNATDLSKLLTDWGMSCP